jgi:hypothetical protein
LLTLIKIPGIELHARGGLIAVVEHRAHQHLSGQPGPVTIGRHQRIEGRQLVVGDESGAGALSSAGIVSSATLGIWSLTATRITSSSGSNGSRAVGAVH